MREKTSRNCSRLVATLRISFSPALPARKKCLDFIPIHVSFAATGESSLRLKAMYVAERRARQKAKAPRFILSPPNSANLNRSEMTELEERGGNLRFGNRRCQLFLGYFVAFWYKRALMIARKIEITLSIPKISSGLLE